MFLSIVRPTARIIATRSTIVGTQSIRFLSIGDELKKKVCLLIFFIVNSIFSLQTSDFCYFSQESVEETRYIREQEKKFYEKKKAEKVGLKGQGFGYHVFLFV